MAFHSPAQPSSPRTLTSTALPGRRFPQRWVRGYIDRQWVGMVREEMELLRIAAEEAEAQQRYSAKTNRRDKVIAC